MRATHPIGKTATSDLRDAARARVLYTRHGDAELADEQRDVICTPREISKYLQVSDECTAAARR